MDSKNSEIAMLTEISAEVEDIQNFDTEKEYPVMPLRNLVMFPYVVMPVTIGRSSTLKLVNAAYKKHQSIVLVCQKSAEVDDPGYQDLYPVGVIAKVLRIFEMPGGTTTAIMQSNGP